MSSKVIKSVLEIIALVIIVIVCLIIIQLQTNSEFLLYLIIAIIAVALLLFTKLCIKSMNLPGDSLYNPYGVIELHISNKARKNRRLFFKLCSQCILQGHKENKDVLFYSELLDVNKINNTFGEAAKIRETKFFERIINLYPSKIITCNFRRVKKSYLRVIIDVDMLTDDKINKLKKFAHKEEYTSNDMN